MKSLSVKLGVILIGLVTFGYAEVGSGNLGIVVMVSKVQELGNTKCFSYL